MTDIHINPTATVPVETALDMQERMTSLCAANAEMAETIRELQSLVAAIHQAQPYRYIGRDGKAVLARDLEDRADAAEARVAELEGALRPFSEAAAKWVPWEPENETAGARLEHPKYGIANPNDFPSFHEKGAAAYIGQDILDIAATKEAGNE